MRSSKRDNFTETTRRRIGKQAGWHCSYPWCRRPTVGSNSEGDGAIDVGIAAHIRAAAPGGPRYDPGMSPEQRKSVSNGIWLCETHARLVDSKDPMFTADLLHEWKERAHTWSWHRVICHDIADEVIASKLGEDELCALFRTAAANDLVFFRRSNTWPATAISRTLRVDGVDEQISTTGVAEALATLDDLIIVAEPGMGKTTTVFQIAEAVLEKGYGSPIIVRLGDWSVDGSPLLESILNRSSFGEITEDHLRRIAANPEVILLLDGWNELDGESRRRATVELQRLEMELPHLSLLVATRKQALDVPIDGRRVTLSPLSETNQLEIARALRGDTGERLLDEARRTTGVRELVNIPLYLTVLLALPDDRLDPSRKSGGALHRLHCFCLEFDGACEVQRRVPTDWIIEPVDVSGYGSFSLAS